MEGIDRDVFIVHSEGEEREAALYGALIPRLVDIDISVWHYEDWNWGHQYLCLESSTVIGGGSLEAQPKITCRVVTAVPDSVLRFMSAIYENLIVGRHPI